MRLGIIRSPRQAKDKFMRGYWLAAVCGGLCVTVPTVASANTVVGCWGIDRSGKRFVETSVKDFGELDYNGLMLVLSGWKKHANALGYDYAECNVLGTREKTIVSLEQRRNWNLDHSQSRSAWMDEFVAPAPPRKPDRISITGPSSRPTDGPASADRKRKIGAASSDAPAAPKYIEVAGPDGPIRLSPEVAARNQAAADEYRRKMDAFARAKAEHERTLALHQQNAGKAASAKGQHDREVAANAERVATHKVAMEKYKSEISKSASNQSGGKEGTYQATSRILATRDDAMTDLNSQRRSGELFNIQCKEVTFYKPARWTCWGSYREVRTQSSVSKQ